MKTLNKLVVFSGAGMSAESGISTFRDSDGLWERYRIEEVATPQAWANDSNLVTRFYNMRRKQIMEVTPNEAHTRIAELEKHFNVEVVTQNIDDLHERAGSQNVLHLHGNIMYAKSSGPMQEKAYFKLDNWEITEKDLCPDGYRLRPHVVWFGEAVPAYDEAARTLSEADILIVVGTSLQVYPAAGLIHYSENAREKYLIDPKASEMNLPSDFVKINKGAVEGLNELFAQLTS